ncbi:sulfatase-like hydrolase/transferase [Enterococcus sp. DIV1298c]|uniref:sulfatase-like hydrolase/transferase n=1 Tax=Enterococcus sp. DIV1298c TaxID=2815328 RepID=UPI001F5C7B7B|nr:sulfatase-like hydrolase/transferase [Enterococcus sp. DIV1298c]
MRKKYRKDYGSLTIFIACAMIILQRVLNSAITIPAYSINPGRFYLYSFLQATVVIGTNLIPLYLGYHYKKIAQLKVYHYLSRFSFIYILSALVANIFFYVQSNVLNLRDYWLLFTPISQNYLTYAVSCILLFISIPYVIRFLEKQPSPTIKRFLLFSTLLLVGSSTLFNKDPFALQNGNNIIWIFYLFLFGYGLKKWKWDEKIRFKIPQAFIALLFLVGTILFMVQISLIVRGNADTATRFITPHSLFTMYYTVTSFLSFELISEKLKLKASGTFLATLLIVTQIVCNWSLVTYRVSVFMKREFPNSGRAWLLNLGQFFGYYLLAVSLLCIVLFYLQKIRFVQRLIEFFAFDSLDELAAKCHGVKNWIVSHKSYFFVALFFYLFTFTQIFLLEQRETWKQSIKIALEIFTQRQAPMVLTVLIIMGFFFLLLLLANRFWYAFTATLIINLLLTISTILKMEMREEPVFPSDLKMLAGLSELMSMVSPIVFIAGGLVLIFLTFTSVIMQRRLQKKYSVNVHWKRRIIGILLLSFCFSGVFFINQKNSPSFILFNLFRVNKTFLDQKSAVKDNGPIIQFLNNIDIQIMEKPEGYSEEAINEIMERYNTRAQEINHTRNEWLANQTIILNLSESFSDPDRVPNLTVHNDPIPFVKSKLAEETSGLMLSVGYGGGTANMEWEGLTGLSISNLSASLVTPYTQLVERQDISPNITNLFDEKIAIHPFTAALYRRRQVFDKFGFDQFYYVDGPDELAYTDTIGRNPYISDESAYKDTLRVLKSNLESSQFIQLTTMQNHMPYDDYYDELNYTAEGTAVIASRYSELQTFMQGLHYTDEAVKEFIQEIDKIEKPITFVFYGDHLPSLYSGNDSRRYGLEQRQTDYFIYSNKYSREQSNQLFKEVVSPNNFAPMALEQANIKVTPYYALLTDVANQLPALTIDPTQSVSNRFNGEQIFVTEEKQMIYLQDLHKEQQQLFTDYQLIQYDLVAGKQYSASWAEQGIQDYQK